MINASEVKKITEEAIIQHKKRLLDYFEKRFKPELEALITEKASQGKRKNGEDALRLCRIGRYPHVPRHLP